MNNVEYNPSSNNIKLSLYKIESNNINLIKKTDQQESYRFYCRNNAYIFINIDVGNYLIILNDFTDPIIKPYNLRIGGEFEYLNDVNSEEFSQIKNYFNNMNFLNISDYISPEYILLEKSFYDMKILTAAKNIYNLIYDPYENNSHNQILNNLKSIVSNELNKYGEKLYEYEKIYKIDKTKIKYYFKNALEKIKNDFENVNNLFKKKEKDILLICEDLGEASKNVNVILEKIDGTKREISLHQLKNIINGDIFRKQHFYGSIRGYTVTDYGIEEVNPNQKFEQTNLFKEILIKEMPNLFKINKDLLKDCEFYFPIINEDIEIDDLVDRNLYDIVFVIDSTNSMKKYIDAVTEKCRDIIEEINSSYSNEKKIKYGAVLYADIVDNKKCENILIQLTPDKDELKLKLENVQTQSGGDGVEDWNNNIKILSIIRGKLNEIRKCLFITSK